MLILLVDKIDHHFHHYVFFFGFAFGDHEGEGNEGVVGDALGAVLTVKDAIIIEEPKEQGGCDTFVAIGECEWFR